MELVKKTSLQKIDQNTHDTLTWKLAQLNEKNLPIESGLADYIAFGMEGIDNDIQQLQNYKALIDAQIKQAKENQAKVKTECADWLKGQGIEKLNGLNVSSITINKGKEATTKEKTVEKWVWTTLEDDLEDEVDYQGMQSLLFELGYISPKKVKQTTRDNATEDQIKVNKKRK